MERITNEGVSSLFDLEAEKMLINSVVGGGGSFSETSAIIKADAFYDAGHRAVWQAMEAVHARHAIVDMMSVYVELSQMGKDAEKQLLMGVGHYSLTNALSTAAYLADLHDRRRLLRVSIEMQSMCYDMNDDAMDIIKHVKDKCGLIENNGTTDEIAVKDVMLGLLKSCEDRINSPEEVGIATGFRGIDRKGGLCPSDLSIIAGEPSNGKTSFAMSIAKNVAMSGVPVAVYTLEMTVEQLAARMVAMQGRAVSSSAILHRALTQTEIDNVCSSAYKMMDMPMYFDKKSNANIDKILSSIKRMVMKFGIKVVVIDYLQLITTNSKNHDRVLQLADITRSLKNIAKDLSISVILLSQLKRDDDPVPTVKRLRGSGEIEEAADNVYLVYYADRYKKSYPGGWKGYSTRNTALIFQAKGRNSGVGEFLTKFYPEFTLYEGFAEGEEMPKASDDYMTKPVSRPDAPF